MTFKSHYNAEDETERSSEDCTKLFKIRNHRKIMDWETREHIDAFIKFMQLGAHWFVRCDGKQTSSRMKCNQSLYTLTMNNLHVVILDVVGLV